VPRGRLSQPGDTMVNANGYHHTKTASQGWRLTHHILAEQKLGRPLHADEMVRFKDADRANLTVDNVEVIVKTETTIKKRIAKLTSRIDELYAERAELIEELRASEEAKTRG